MQAIVLADGDTGSRERLDATWPAWARPDALVIAADGGARHAARLGLQIDRWVGDGDSLGEAGVEELVAAGIPVERAAPDKDESDTELAVLTACRLGADELVILGALGGARVDHALANVALLGLPELSGLDVRLLAADARLRQLHGPGAANGTTAHLDLEGRVGDLVTLLPVGGDADGVTTRGLRFALDDEPLRVGRTRGLSNVRTASLARVTLRQGRLLIVETPATLPP
jgi:thiamine pyrophosphokinase